LNPLGPLLDKHGPCHVLGSLRRRWECRLRGAC
jgi:hypothetical protein